MRPERSSQLQWVDRSRDAEEMKLNLWHLQELPIVDLFLRDTAL